MQFSFISFLLIVTEIAMTEMCAKKCDLNVLKIMANKKISLWLSFEVQFKFVYNFKVKH